MSILQKQIMEEVFVDFEPMIRKLANRYNRICPAVSTDEWASVGNEAFLRAVETHDPSRSSLSTHIYFRVNKAMAEERRNYIRRIQREKLEAELVETVPSQKPVMCFWKSLFLDLGEDARVIVKMALDSPPEIAEIIQAKGGHPHNIRSTIRQHLQGTGWTTLRIKEGFQEIVSMLR